jgi:hypothetical protein
MVRALVILLLVIPLLASAADKKNRIGNRDEKPPVICQQMRFEALQKQLITCSDGSQYWLDLNQMPPLPPERR